MPGPAARGFVTTRWSLVLAAGQPGTPEAHKALSELCALYWYPLYDFIRRQGLPVDKAKDLTQGFLARVLEKNDLAVVEPGRGRFRSWLLASVKHYLANEWDRERAEKRGGARVQIDIEDAEALFNQEPMPGLTPERAFERHWAMSLLRNVLTALGEEYKREGQELRFEKLKQTITGEEGASYVHIATELGMKEGTVKKAAFRLRQRYQELLLEELSHTVEKPEDVADELRFLISAIEDG
ncbi:sigma-70 family RNA polymerase sigma factor [Archangium sp.]|uniref:RNA polymerase sigma factor n=1 Tax=Archangium sp. TaxID=1872627 RepID=UPI002D4E732D|nr:sigma-70 family RNA polymerase sigma factor [Archangium sp.]HYO59819.1 sigma-70 family RNA polymerase sigma factor [Archangium sp.]